MTTNETTGRIRAGATDSAPALLLRRWEEADAAALAEAYRDESLRRWTSHSVPDEESALRWIREQGLRWEAGDRFAFAVVESGAEEGPVGHVVVKGVVPGGGSAEVGYWTAAHARGRRVASRALEALTGWAFATFAGQGLRRLELLHQVDNEASCRVARACGYERAGTLPAAPPAYPLEGHLHVRRRVSGVGP
ncbi:GNAT family N-acetyltransferase [Streptomyces anandii]|uniref:GNAT family N-acetyltransferase n=1 Tax=Streptomyces anandii TaxID=285454 RepID=UPI0016799324|nr:GNAT family N-acetyltransferase [Streptomyces anandii]GGX70506.1 acetyltransferase [Streptomyces anandii JCM 4720]